MIILQRNLASEYRFLRVKAKLWVPNKANLLNTRSV